MSKESTANKKLAALNILTEGAIHRLKELPQPVVRVSGPLTSGGFGYEENLKRFVIAQEKLRTQGYTVFDYFKGNQDERKIITLELPWEEIMVHYHNPIMNSGLIQTVFMMPGWRESKGAVFEHNLATELGLQIRTIPESWFD